MLGAELGVDDLLVGVALAGRSRLEMQGLVGCFVNLLPLAVGLRPGQSAEWRLRQVGHDLLELLEHQDVPLECVTQALRQRGASGLPIRMPAARTTVGRPRRWMPGCASKPTSSRCPARAST